MANLYVTGPAHIYVGTGNIAPSSSGSGSSGMAHLLNYPSASLIYYLGTCETAPRILINPKYKALFADIGGDEVPFDWMFMGEDAQVGGVLTRWNESVYAQCASRPYPRDDTRGTHAANAVGRLMLSQGVAYHLWIHFPYYSKAPYSARNMPAGYHFYGAWMAGPDEINPGTRASKRTVMFQCGRVYDAATGTWKLYDHTMTFIPSIPPSGLTDFSGIVT